MARPRKDGPQVDWRSIYNDWLTGAFNHQELARKHNVSATSVGRKIREDGWTTDYGPGDDPRLSEDDEPTTPSEPPAKAIKTKSLSSDALRKRAKDLAQRLLSEVEDITTYEGEIRQIILKEEADPVRRRAALKAISAAERIKMTKDLTAIFDAVDGKKNIPKTLAEKPSGKKEQQQEEAAKVAAGRFAPRTGPRLVSGGGA